MKNIAFLIVAVFVCGTLLYSKELRASDWAESDNFDVQRSSLYFDRNTRSYKTQFSITNNSDHTIVKNVRIIFNQTSHEILNADGTESSLPFFNVNNSGESWAIGETKVVSVQLELRRAAPLFLFDIEENGAENAIHAAVESYRQLQNLPKDYFVNQYRNGKKWYISISKGSDLPSFGELSGSITIDLMDYLGITEEGRNGWISYSIDGSFGLGFGVGLSDTNVGVNFQLWTENYDESIPDALGGIGFTIFDLNTPIPAINFSFLEGSTSAENGLPGFSLGGMSLLETEIGVHFLNTTYVLQRGEVDRVLFDVLIGQLAKTIHPSVGYAVQGAALNSFINRFKKLDEDDPSFYREYSSLDDGTPASYDGVVSSINFIAHGRNSNTTFVTDCNDDLVFPEVENGLFDITSWDSQHMVINVKNTGGNQNDYKVKAIEIPDGWYVAALDAGIVPNFLDKSFKILNVNPSEIGSSLWAISADYDAVPKGKLVFEIYEEEGERLIRTVTLDVVAESAACLDSLNASFGEYKGYRGGNSRNLTLDGSPSTKNQDVYTFSVSKTNNFGGSSSYSSNMVIGDFSGDSEREVIVVKQNTLKVFDADLNTLQTIALPANAYSILLADVDGDNKDEVVLGTYKTNQHRIMIVDSNGPVKSIRPRTGPSYQASGQSANVESYLGEGKLLVRYNAGYARDNRGFAVIDINTSSEDWYYDIGPIPRYFVTGNFDSDDELEFAASVFTPHNGASGNGTNDGNLYMISVDENGGREYSHIFGDDTAGGANGHTELMLTQMTDSGSPVFLATVGHYSSYRGQTEIRLVDPDTGATTKRANFFYSEQSSMIAVDSDDDGNKEVIALSRHSDRGLIYDHNLNQIGSIPFGGTIFAVTDLDGDGDKEYVMVDRATRNKLRVVNTRDQSAELTLTTPTSDPISLAVPTDADKDGETEIYILDKYRVYRVSR